MGTLVDIIDGKNALKNNSDELIAYTSRLNFAYIDFVEI